MRSPSFIFSFNVGATFLSAPGHPITVPKEQVDYSALDASGLGRTTLTVIFPRGEQSADQFYKLFDGATAQRGAYRQLRMSGGERSLPKYLKLNDRLIVLVYRYGQRSFVALEYR